jgi:cilia- and flagella-associated protein 69
VEIGVGRDLICIINESKDFRSYVVSLAIEALWNLIEVGGSVAISHLASYPEAIPSLKSQFDKVMLKGHKKDDKCLRNELCVLMNFIVSSAESHQYFMVAGDKGECILESMIKYAVYDEI